MGSILSSPSPTAPAYLTDYMLTEISLRLPPHPSYLLRTSILCKHFYRLINDPGFLRRFRCHHNETPPLLGFYHNEEGLPNRFLPVNGGDVVARAFTPIPKDWSVIDCRHGLVLFQSLEGFNFLVWDPMTRHEEFVSAPLEYREDYFFSNAALVCTTDGDDDGGGEFQFQIIFVTFDKDEVSMSVSVYSSEEEGWTLPVCREMSSVIDTEVPSVLVGNVVYWTLLLHSVLAFDLDTHEVSDVREPHDPEVVCDGSLLVMEDGSLGFASVKRKTMSLHLWALGDVDAGTGEQQWSLRRALDLDIQLPKPVSSVQVLGKDEDTKEVLIQMDDALFSLKLETLQLNKVLDHIKMYESIFPYKRFYLKGRRIGVNRLNGQNKIGWRKQHAPRMIDRD